MKEKFSITGMTCSACSSGIEKSICKMDGVLDAQVSLMGECMTVEFDASRLQSQQIIDKVISLGYGAKAYEENVFKEKQLETDKLKTRFLLSIIFLIPLMYLSMGGMIGLPQPDLLLNYSLQAVLSALLIVVNFRFFTVGARAVLNGSPNMDTLVALGSAVSYLYSAVLTVFAFFGHGNHHGAHLFFESAGMILALVTLGKWLEEKSKRKTGEEVEKLIKLMPNTVTISTQNGEKSIAFSEISIGDVLIVKQGDYIPVDGRIVDGYGFIDRSAITGESLPIEVQTGDCVTGADIVKSGYLHVLAEKVGSQTTLSQIIKMVKSAGASKAPIQMLADKIAGIFVPIVTGIAVLTFILWLIFTGDLSQAANYAISVLVISCPCSLGLATPVAVMAATGKGMSLGVLFKDAEILQKAKDVNCVLLDKTATLTVGQPKVTDFECLQGDELKVLEIACSIEQKSNHPIAECIKEYALSKIQNAQMELEQYSYEMGKGATATIDEEKVFLGNRKVLNECLQAVAFEYENKYSKEGKTVVFLAKEEVLLAVFAIADTLKESSVEAVSLLKERGIATEMLTGDIQSVASSISEKVGIDTYFAEALPADKAKRVTDLREEGKIVAMVGDGINDSPALKTADVGVAMGTGTDIAIESADVVLVGGDLRSVSIMIDLSKETVKNIKQNLFWAFFYNIVAIPIAGGMFAWLGLRLNPMIAAACMSLSSLFVVTNALRLTRFKPQIKVENMQAEGDLMNKTLKIEGMMCQHCVAHVTKALQTIDGVESVEVNLKKKTAVVTSQVELSNEALMNVIVEAGYTVKKIS